MGKHYADAVPCLGGGELAGEQLSKNGRGILGTVTGFFSALAGIDPATGSDVKSISPMVSELLAGMAVALYTTLAGATLNLWLTINHRLLAGTTARLIASLVERGEEDECA